MTLLEYIGLFFISALFGYATGHLVLWWRSRP